MNQKDIAQLLRVSPSTVSMALRGTGRISDRVREKVLTLSSRHHVTIRPTGPSKAASPKPANGLRIGYCGLHDLHAWFHAGTLTAATGTVNVTMPPTLTWSGYLTPTPVVTITYAVTVTVETPQIITNTVVINALGYETITRIATVRANWPTLLVQTV